MRTLSLGVAAALFVALGCTEMASAQTPAYDGGSFYAGQCANKYNLVFPGFFAYSNGISKQEALDSCLSAFGESVVGFSWDYDAGQTFTCYLEGDDFTTTDPPDGWYGDNPDGSYVSGEVARGSEYLATSTCYDFKNTDSRCSARVLAVVDSTFATRYPKPAILNAVEAIKVAGFAAAKMPFSTDVEFGIVEVKRTSLKWHVHLDDETASVPGDLVHEFYDIASTLSAGSRAYGSKFPPLFRGVADRLASSEKRSYMLLITDGQLLNPSHVENYVDLKRKMVERLGASAPTVICVRLFAEVNTPFLDVVCDSTWALEDFPYADYSYNSFFYNDEDDQKRALANVLGDEICQLQV